jgi:hypothetical protein
MERENLALACLLLPVSPCDCSLSLSHTPTVMPSTVLWCSHKALTRGWTYGTPWSWTSSLSACELNKCLFSIQYQASDILLQKQKCLMTIYHPPTGQLGQLYMWRERERESILWGQEFRNGILNCPQHSTYWVKKKSRFKRGKEKLPVDRTNSHSAQWFNGEKSEGL